MQRRSSATIASPRQASAQSVQVTAQSAQASMARTNESSGFPFSWGWVLSIASTCMAGSSFWDDSCRSRENRERNRRLADSGYRAVKRQFPEVDHGFPKVFHTEAVKNLGWQMVGGGVEAQRRAGSGEGRVQIRQRRGDREIPEALGGAQPPPQILALPFGHVDADILREPRRTEPQRTAPPYP